MAGAEVKGPAAAVLRPIGGMRVTVWLGMSAVAVQDKVDDILRDLARTRHEGPEQN